jgi:hypothetical protein
MREIERMERVKTRYMQAGLPDEDIMLGLDSISLVLGKYGHVLGILETTMMGTKVEEIFEKAEVRSRRFRFHMMDLEVAIDGPLALTEAAVTDYGIVPEAVESWRQFASSYGSSNLKPWKSHIIEGAERVAKGLETRKERTKVVLPHVPGIDVVCDGYYMPGVEPNRINPGDRQYFVPL